MRAPYVRELDNDVSGYWEIWVDPLGSGEPVNVTRFRGVPASVDSMSTTDPFGPATASISFSTITLLDRPGVDDLWWLQPEANVDISWTVPGVNGNESVVVYTWQGYFLSFEYGEEDAGGKLTITCQGAMRQLDNYLAKPEYLSRPLSYEYAIARQFEGRPDLRLMNLDMSSAFPRWWNTVYNSNGYTAQAPYMVPMGPLNGDPWTGMVTRETGKFEQVLSNYVQGLLSNMYTDRGQFTLMLGDNRTPRLVHRDIKTVADESTLVVHILWPGVQMTVTRDYSQRLNVVYGQGRSLNGNAFSNMQVTADGSRTFFAPFAYRRDVFPSDKSNPWLEKGRMRKEVSLSFYQGIDANEAYEVSRKHLQRFAEPGATGQLTLKTDPIMNDYPFPRQMIQAGMTVQVKGLFGEPEGILFHITEQNLNSTGDVTLTLDSKYRDQLTVQEVRKRGRDSLVPVRMMSVGSYAPNIPDILHPWTYAEGSGFMPIGSNEMFKRANEGTTAVDVFTGSTDLYMTGYDFPWEGITTKYPPKLNPSYYAHLGPANADNPDYNWTQKGINVRLASKGDIRLLQIAAFDKDGNPKRVPFHASVYYEYDVKVSNMPLMSAADAADTPYVKPSTAATFVSTGTIITFTAAGHGFAEGDLLQVSNFTGSLKSLNNTWRTVSAVTPTTFTISVSGAAGSGSCTVYYSPAYHYPFFPNAWEQYLPDGTKNTNIGYKAGAQLIVGYGSSYEKAGYWPSSSSTKGALPTGYLVDETGFNFDFTSTNGVRITEQPNPGSNDNSSVENVMVSVMIYCDEELDTNPDSATYNELVPLASDVYFVGRFFRKEPGND